ncbi:MAG: c-type cytochrome [Qingshengfaniella sp.]
MRPLHILGLTALITTAASPMTAQDFAAPLGARQGEMQILALNLGVLGGMARGSMAYDPTLATAAAGNIVAVASLNQAPFWPEGSDAGSIADTRAEAAIWSGMDDFAMKWADLGDAAQSLETAAANGQEALGPALGQIGGACKACHDTYRTPE